jgi:hypothetical protein
MKTIVAVALAVVSSFFTCLAQTYAPDLDLSTASPTEVVKVAQSDAKEFYQEHKSNPLNDSTVMDYATGRALKHGLLESASQAHYVVSFSEVVKQLEIDKK